MSEKEKIRILYFVIFFALLIIIISTIMHCFYMNRLDCIADKIKIVNDYDIIDKSGIVEDGRYKERVK